MRMKFPLLLLFGSLAMSAIWAGDPWTDKLSSTWTEADVMMILSDSPWVRNARVTAPWIEGRPAELRPLVQGCEGRLALLELESPHDQGMLRKSVVVYRISWISSRTYREAVARRVMLCGSLKENESDALSEDLGDSEFVLYVESPDMTIFKDADEAIIQKNTFLLGKKSRTKSNPTRVQLRSKDGKLSGLLLHFPRDGAANEPILRQDESELVFSYNFGKSDMRATFQLDRMVRPEGKDF